MYRSGEEHKIRDNFVLPVDWDQTPEGRLLPVNSFVLNIAAGVGLIKWCESRNVNVDAVYETHEEVFLSFFAGRFGPSHEICETFGALLYDYNEQQRIEAQANARAEEEEPAAFVETFNAPGENPASNAEEQGDTNGKT